MTHSKHTNEIRLTSQSSPRQGAGKTHVEWHHTASVSGRGEGIVAMMVNKTRTVSANYVIGSDGYIWMVVDEDLRAWTSGSSTDGGKGAAFDRKSITHECCNSTGAPSWLQSDAFYDSAAKLALDYFQRYGIPLDRDHHLGHRELWIRYGASYPTACPGGMDIDRILNQAKALMDPGAIEREKAEVRAVGAYLNSLHLGLEYPGWGDVQTGAAIDGIPQDPNETFSRYYLMVQMWGAKFRPDLYPQGEIDGIVGPMTRRTEAALRPLVLAGTAPGQVPPPPVVVKAGDSLTVSAATAVFPSAAKARENAGSTATYQPGSYFVYKVNGDAINISKTAGKPGGWVLASALKVLTNKWLVTFDYDDDTDELKAVEVDHGGLVPQPLSPSLEGHTFDGWFDKKGNFADLFDFATPITSNLDLEAAWEEIVPEPEPEPEPEDPDEPEGPGEPDLPDEPDDPDAPPTPGSDTPPSWFVKFIQSLIEWLSNLFKSNK